MHAIHGSYMTQQAGGIRDAYLVAAGVAALTDGGALCVQGVALGHGQEIK